MLQLFLGLALFLQAKDDDPLPKRVERGGVFVQSYAAGADIYSDNDTTERLWSVGCKIDAMTDERTCSINRHPVEPGDPFITFLDGRDRAGGVCVQQHNFPGRSAAIRIDGRPAIPAGTAGCVSLAVIARQLHDGKIWTSRRYTWPNDFPVDHKIDLKGLSVALDILLKLRSIKRAS